MLIDIHHATTCRYPQAVGYTIQQLRLTPRAEPRQRIVSWRITAPGRRRQLTDAHGNISHLLTLDQPHREISIVVDGAVEVTDGASYLLHDPGVVSPLAYLAETPLTRADEVLRALALRRLAGRGDRLRALMELLPDICERVDGLLSPEAVRQADERGREHAHAFLACCRAVGIPGRFVSGYFQDEGRPVACHAWADAWVDGSGWIGIDVTHQRLAGAAHCRLAVGRDHLDACPVRGVPRDGAAVVQVLMQVSSQQQQQ
jgi:transglutaminase-like putative cysteine protease